MKIDFTLEFDKQGWIATIKYKGQNYIGIASHNNGCSQAVNDALKVLFTVCPEARRKAKGIIK